MSTYNGEKHLREQIDSILSQDASSNIKLIIRDDGSTDGTIEILNEYKSKNLIEYYQSKLEKYTDIYDKIGKSFFDLCKSAPQADYYAFADQDDFWQENKLSEAIKLLEQQENQNKPLLYCSYARLFDKELCLLKHKRPKRNSKSLKYYRVLMRPVAPGCTYVFNKTAHEKFLKYKGEYLGIHDWAIQKIVALTGTIVYDKNSYIKYRQHHDNVCGTTKTSPIKRFKEVWSQFSLATSNSAREILNSYQGELTKEQIKHLDLLANYRFSFIKKIKLLLNSKLTGNDVSHKIGAKIMVLFNRL